MGESEMTEMVEERDTPKQPLGGDTGCPSVLPMRVCLSVLPGVTPLLAPPMGAHPPCPSIPPRPWGPQRGCGDRQDSSSTARGDTLTLSPTPPDSRGQGVQAPLSLCSPRGIPLKIKAGKTSAFGLKPRGRGQITFFNQNRCVWPQNSLWPPKSSSSSLAKPPSRPRCAPEPRPGALSGRLCPVSSSAGARGGTGGASGGQRPLGALGGVLEHLWGLRTLGGSWGTWGGSQSTWGLLRVLGESQRHLRKVQTPTLHLGWKDAFLLFSCILHVFLWV